VQLADGEERQFQRRLARLKGELEEKRADRKPAEDTKKALQEAKKQAAKGAAK
jgi:hypothetical protein